MNAEIERRIAQSVAAHYGDHSGIASVRPTPIEGTFFVVAVDGMHCMVGGVKQCAKCGKWNPGYEFAIRNGKYGDGLQDNCKACNAEYYRANKARYDDYHASYRKEHADRRKSSNKAGNHNRRARLKAADGAIRASDVTAIRTAQTDKRGRLICWKCGKPITGRPHLDHWIPLKHGGRNDAGNLHYMHAKCNLEKGAKMPEEIGRLL